MSPVERLERWLDESIIGLDLCPFAARVRRAQGVRIAAYEVDDPIDAVHTTLGEAIALLAGEHEGVQTTLVAITRGLEDFRLFLDVVATAEEALVEAGAGGVLQIASFHPDYRFADTTPEAVSHFTNRAPFPVLHLLREADVSDAVDRHPDPGGIPAANIARLERMGLGDVRELWRRWSGTP